MIIGGTGAKMDLGSWIIDNNRMMDMGWWKMWWIGDKGEWRMENRNWRREKREQETANYYLIVDA